MRLKNTMGLISRYLEWRRRRLTGIYPYDTNDHLSVSGAIPQTNRNGRRTWDADLVRRASPTQSTTITASSYDPIPDAINIGISLASAAQPNTPNVVGGGGDFGGAGATASWEPAAPAASNNSDDSAKSSWTSSSSDSNYSASSSDGGSSSSDGGSD